MSWSSYVNHIAMHDMTLVTEHKKSPGRCLLRSRRMSQEPSKFFCYSHRTRPLVAITKNAPAQRRKLHSWLLLGCSLSVGIGTDLLLPDRTSLWQPEVLKHWILGKTCLCVARMLVQGRVISVTEKFGLFLFQNSTNHRGRRWWLLSLFFFFFAPWCSVPAVVFHQGRKGKWKPFQIHLSFTHQSPDALLHSLYILL